MTKSRTALFCILTVLGFATLATPTLPAQVADQSTPTTSALAQTPTKTHDASAKQADRTRQEAEQTPSSQHKIAEEQLKKQEKQRILGVIPNFNTTDIQDAAPLTTSQKFHLAFKSALDPFQFVASGLDAGLSQARDDYSGYGQGAQGYFKRFGASYADQFDGALWGNAVFPSLLHEDPRYFRKGNGTFMSRLLYAAKTTVVTKNDNGTYGPNYANVLGNIVAGGIANAYYPSSDRGAGLTFERAFTVTAMGTIGSIFVEFWPDIDRKVFHRHKAGSIIESPAK